MALIRTKFTQQLQQEGAKVFWDSYPAIPSVWESLFEEETTDRPYKQSASMVGLGDLEEKGESEPYTYDAPADGWPTLGKVRTFGRKFAMSMETFEDTQIYNTFMDTISQWSQSYINTRDRFYAKFFNEGALTAGSDVFDNTVKGVIADPTGKYIYDGRPLFADAANPHPCMHADITMANYMPLELTIENFLLVYQAMQLQNSFDERGEEFDLAPDTLLVHPSLELKAKEILGSVYLPNAQTTPSIKNPAYQLVTPVKWRRLSDPNAWYLLQRGKGLKALNRKTMDLRVYVDDDTDAVVARIVCRFGGYVNNHRYLFGCNIDQG